MIMAPDDLTYLLNIVDLSYAMNAVPITIRKVDPTTVIPSTNLYEEVIDKKWITATLNCIAVPNPDPRVLDRFAIRTGVRLLLSVAQEELTRKNWVMDPEDVIEYYNADGVKVDFYIIEGLPDGRFRDTDGRETPLSYTMTLTDMKAPT